jgi:hypothetical protein
MIKKVGVAKLDIDLKCTVSSNLGARIKSIFKVNNETVIRCT